MLIYLLAGYAGAGLGSAAGVMWGYHKIQASASEEDRKVLDLLYNRVVSYSLFVLVLWPISIFLSLFATDAVYNYLTKPVRDQQDK